jgi:hypothetical protein
MASAVWAVGLARVPVQGAIPAKLDGVNRTPSVIACVVLESKI